MRLPANSIMSLLPPTHDVAQCDVELAFSIVGMASTHHQRHNRIPESRRDHAAAWVSHSGIAETPPDLGLPCGEWVVLPVPETGTRVSPCLCAQIVKRGDRSAICL